MTRDEAVAIRQRQVNGKPVLALELQEAILTLQRIGNSRCGPRKFRLPELPRPVKEACNSALCFNLGLAIGRSGKS